MSIFSETHCQLLTIVKSLRRVTSMFQSVGGSTANLVSESRFSGLLAVLVSFWKSLPNATSMFQSARHDCENSPGLISGLQKSVFTFITGLLKHGKSSLRRFQEGTTKIMFS
jgi:hypothetical protein